MMKLIDCKYENASKHFCLPCSNYGCSYLALIEIALRNKEGKAK